jgi:VWFA-related protein
VVAAAPASSAPAPAVPAIQSAYSNRGTGPVKAAAAETPANTIVLLIDPNLSFDELTSVRQQMIQFLNGLHQDERAALLAMKPGTFQVLQEPTTDHALLAATLAKWRPGAQSVMLGQEQEARNRQTMETVMNPESLLDVNGRTQTDPQLNQEVLDPNLRTLGDRPGQGALSGLVEVARHLAAIPGHKSLIWIASDNVLADWTNSSINIDKGDKFIDAVALRTQEAMNNAHVSVYPLDASRLEASVINASIGNRNVELTPTYIVPPMTEKALEGPEANSGLDINSLGKLDLRPGRASAQLQQDMHAIQGVYRELADATGGRIFRRASDIVGEFNSVAADGRATYLLSFTPAVAADGKYHIITVKIPGRKDVNLRYRTGFFYREEPSTIQDRFREAVLEPEDATGIALTADPVPGSNGRTVKLAIAATDLEIAQKDAFWTDKLSVYLVQREVSGSKARITGQTLGLRLSPASYQKYLREGIPFNQTLEAGPGVGSVRIVVLDENSGRMGSVTIPAAAIAPKS